MELARRARNTIRQLPYTPNNCTATHTHTHTIYQVDNGAHHHVVHRLHHDLGAQQIFCALSRARRADRALPTTGPMCANMKEFLWQRNECDYRRIVIGGGVDHFHHWHVGQMVNGIRKRSKPCVSSKTPKTPKITRCFLTYTHTQAREYMYVCCGLENELVHEIIFFIFRNLNLKKNELHIFLSFWPTKAIRIEVIEKLRCFVRSTWVLINKMRNMQIDRCGCRSRTICWSISIMKLCERRRVIHDVSSQNFITSTFVLELIWSKKLFVYTHTKVIWMAICKVVLNGCCCVLLFFSLSEFCFRSRFYTMNVILLW